MLNLLRRFAARQEGAATIEFVIIFPMVVATVFSAVDAGFLMTRYMTLDRGVDITVRELRLGLDTDADHDSIRGSICSHARLLQDCESTLIVELVEQTNAEASFPNNNANCLDRTGEVEPVIATSSGGGGAGEIMYLRVCALVEPIIPGMGVGLLLPKDASGAHRMITYTAFMNEPV